MQSEKGPNWRTAWGYDFEWTPLHMTKEQMRPLIFSYDHLASECLERLDKFSPGASSLRRKTNKKASESESSGADGKDKEDEKKGHQDLYSLLRVHADEDEKLQELWREVNTVPEWVDWDQIERGQKVFYRYGGPSVVALTFQSLLGGMGGTRVVETLARTGGFGVKVARRRLLETFQHLLDVTRDIESVKPGGDGWTSSIRVRFLHAAVRRRIMQLVKEKPDYYNVEQFGVPVNDLDSIGTISTFSATLIWVSFPRQGIYLRRREIADYIALWRWIAHVLGTPTDFFSSPARARAIMESLLVAEIHPTTTGGILANNIIAGLQGQPPSYASAGFLQAEAHWLNGRELAVALAVPQPNMYYTALVVGQCFFFMAMCYIHRSVPILDEYRIKSTRKLLQTLTRAQIGDGDAPARHGFKYVPNLGQMTEPARLEEMGLLRGGVEGRNLVSLLAAGLALAMAVWAVWNGAKGAVARL